MRTDEQIIEDYLSYLETVEKIHGVSVLTVDDGWLFTFTTARLKSLLDAAEASASGRVRLMVNSSATIAKSKAGSN